MYTGKNKTAITSQNAIADALVRLMQKKPYSSVSISELCQEAGVSRQTFYTLFSDKENVIYYQLERKHEYDPEEKCCCSRADITLRDICESYSAYIIDKSPFLTLLVDNHMEYCIEWGLYRTFFDTGCFGKGRCERERAYVAGFLAGGLKSVARNYVLEDPRPGQQELSDMIYRLFSGDAFRM